MAWRRDERCSRRHSATVTQSEFQLASAAALDGGAPPCESGSTMEATMALWRWIVGLFRGKPVDPPAFEDRRFADARASSAANAAAAGVNSSSPGI